jgi:hypothetical protein
MGDLARALAAFIALREAEVQETETASGSRIPVEAWRRHREQWDGRAIRKTL